MNEKTRKLRDIVERATAAPDDLPSDLDAETASLRSAWMQLGALVERDVQSNCGRDCDHARVQASSPPPALRRRQPAWTFWLVTSAASLLVAVGIAAAVRFSGGPRAPQRELPQIARSHDSAVPIQWSDPVDDEISAVGQATVYAQQDAYVQSSVWEIETGLDDLKQEVEHGNL